MDPVYDGVSVVSAEKLNTLTPSSVNVPLPNESATGIVVSKNPVAELVCIAMVLSLIHI